MDCKQPAHTQSIANVDLEQHTELASTTALLAAEQASQTRRDTGQLKAEAPAASRTMR